MKAMLLSLLAVSSVIASSQESDGSSQEMEECPTLPGQVPFDCKKFEGDWYSIARTDVSVAPHDNATCWKNVVHCNDTRMDVRVLSDYKDNTNKTFDIRGMFTDIKEDGAELQSAYNLGPGQAYRGVAKEAILATDYDNFALHYGCIEYYDPGCNCIKRLILAEVWCRKREMDPEELEALKTVVSSTDYLTESAITDVNQSGCKE